MKRRTISVLMMLFLVLGMCACGQKTAASTWQEQYDLGVRYLSEGNYEEAIIAFTAAIEIDPKQAPAYIGRGGAYVEMGEPEGNLAAALADYEKAVEVDETNAEAYLGLADVYIRQGEYDKALEILRDALTMAVNIEDIAQKIKDMEAGTFADSGGKTRKSVHIEGGEVVQYWLYEYDPNGLNIRTMNYDASGALKRTEESEFNTDGLEIRCIETDVDGNCSILTFEYGSDGRCVKEIREDIHQDEYGAETNICYTIISYDDNLRTETHDDYYTSDGVDELSHRFVMEYDENWVRQRGSSYLVDDNGELYLDYYVEYIWNVDGSYGGFEHFQVANHAEND